MNIFENTYKGKEYTMNNGHKVHYIKQECEGIHIVGDGAYEWYILDDGSCFDPFLNPNCNYYDHSISI